MEPLLSACTALATGTPVVAEAEAGKDPKAGGARDITAIAASAVATAAEVERAAVNIYQLAEDLEALKRQLESPNAAVEAAAALGRTGVNASQVAEALESLKQQVPANTSEAEP